MDRRRFLLTSLAGTLAGPLAAGAARSERMYRIGILANIPLADPEGAPLWGAFLQGLQPLGYTEGRNVTIEWRVSGGKYERLHDLAAELASRNVDVILVPADQNAVAAGQATRTTPVVMIGDPVASGLAASLARPEGNATGLSASWATRSSGSGWNSSRPRFLSSPGPRPDDPPAPAARADQVSK
jgi:putative ABC transport system substrate-binding protein